MFSAHAGIELYAEAFEAAGKLDRLEGFASDFGADFYGLPRNTGRITLAQARLDVRRLTTLPWAERRRLVPMRAGEAVAWQLVS